MDKEKRSKIIRLIALIPVIAITIGVFLLRDQIQNLKAYGLPGIFLLSILANATVIIPVPGVILTTTMGAVFPPFWVAIAAGSGAALGEITGYLAGYSGQIAIEHRPRYQQLVNWMRKYGDWTILVLAFIPNPAFDMAGIVAGALKMPLHRFLVWCWLGKILKMMVFAYAGAGIFYWLETLFVQ